MCGVTLVLERGRRATVIKEIGVSHQCQVTELWVRGQRGPLRVLLDVAMLWFA